MTNDIRPGDIVIDLANGRSMHVQAKAADRADEWSERNSYQLEENYANGRFEMRDSDTVWTCVYANDLMSKPSKDYDFPESRIKRVETEKATASGRRVQDRLVRDTLAGMMEAIDEGDQIATTDDVIRVAANRSGVDSELIKAASELAETRRTALADGGER